MTDFARVGARLRTARENLGLTQQVVAGALGLPRTAVTNIESGNRSVSTLELTKLAAMYNRAVSSLLVDEPASQEDHATILLRAVQRADENPDCARAVSRVLGLCREGASLRALLGYAVAEDLPDYAGRVRSVGDAIRQGDLVAREERRRLGLGDAPVGNIAGAISAQGVWTAACNLPEYISGLFIHDRDAGLAVIINGRHSHAPTRQRFSYAHEYAHALLDRAEPCRVSQRENATELVETRANAFAASFLMPAGGIEEQLRLLDKGRRTRQLQIVYDVARDVPSEAEIRPSAGSQTITWQDASVIASWFGVSYESAVWRMRNLGHLDAPETNALLAQKDRRKRLEDMLEPRRPKQSQNDRNNDQDMELRAQIIRLAIEAYRREEISSGRLRELASRLDLPADDLIALADTGQD